MSPAGKRSPRRGSGRGSNWQPETRRYPRTARVNEVLREVLAEELGEFAASDSRLDLMTITAVECDSDLRHAKVLLASLSEPARTALSEVRINLQAAIARQVRLKRTPQLSFEVDPAILHGEKVEQIIRSIHSNEELPGSSAEGSESSQ